MKKETVAVAKTIEAAVEKGAAELGFTADRVSYEVLTEPKKGISRIWRGNGKGQSDIQY